MRIHIAPESIFHFLPKLRNPFYYTHLRVMAGASRGSGLSRYRRGDEVLDARNYKSV